MSEVSKGESHELANRKVVSGEVFGFHKDLDAKTVVLDQMAKGYADAHERITELEAEVKQLRDERQATLDRLKSWGNPTELVDFDNPLVMVITAANDPKSNKFICETLHDFYHSLEVIFFDGDDTRNFDDFWVEGSGVDIRFKRMSRKELDELMDDYDGDWEGF